MSRLQILDEAAKELDAAVEFLEKGREGYGLVRLDKHADKLRQLQRFSKAPPAERYLGYWHTRLKQHAARVQDRAYLTLWAWLRTASDPKVARSS